MLTETDSLMYETKIKDVYEDFTNNKCLILTIICLNQNNMIIKTNKGLVK